MRYRITVTHADGTVSVNEYHWDLDVTQFTVDACLDPNIKDWKVEKIPS